MSSAANDAQVRLLIDTAQRAYSAGKRDEGGRCLDQARSIAPDHPLVFNAFALRALNAGDAAGARRILERAIGVAPEALVLRYSLALTCRALGDTEAEMTALDQALALEPRFFLGLLQKATLLERQGRIKKAAHFYHAVLACAPPGASQNPSLQAAIAHANSAVRANADALEAFLRDRLAADRARHADARQNRFEDCFAVLLGKKRVFVQQPTFLHFPHLPAIEFYDREHFPWLRRLEAATPEICDELMRALAGESEEFVPYVAYPAGTPLDQWKELNHSPRWSTYYLWQDGARVEDHCAHCPTTAAVLAEIPVADVPGTAPTAFFSLLKPKTRIPSHTGVTNTRLTVHLPLMVPDSCGFRVGAETREWRRGEAWIFDDTLEHEAWNQSDEPRVILIFDIWNPFLTDAERDLVRTAVQGVREFYGGESPWGGGL